MPWKSLLILSAALFTMSSKEFDIFALIPATSTISVATAVSTVPLPKVIDSAIGLSGTWNVVDLSVPLKHVS